MLGAAQPALVGTAMAQPVATAIAPQPLAMALAQFSRATGLQSSAPAGLLEGRVSPGAGSGLAPEVALRTLLAGTGLAGRIEGGAILLSPEPPGAAGPEGAVQLPPVHVEGTVRGGGRWAARGFVAEETAAGTKTDTPLLDIPQAINIVTRAEIEAQGSQNIADALRYTPGVFTQYSATDLRYDWLTVRGFTPPLRYLDGLRLPFGARGYAQPRIEPYGLDRLEVLKGPASVLYGQSAPGGLLNMVSRRPTALPQHEVELQTGTRDRLQGAFDLSGPLDEAGEFSYRLTGLYRQADAETQFLDERRVFIAPALTWRPTAETSLTLLAQYQKISSDGGGAAQGLPAIGTLLDNRNGRISTRRSLGEPGYDHFSSEQIMAGWAFEHRFDQTWTVRQNFRYAHVDTDTQRVQAIGLSPDQRSVSRYGWAFPEISDVFTIDNQAQADFTTGPVRHRLLIGLDYQREDTTYEESQLVAVRSLDLFNPVYGASIARPPMATRISQGRNQTGVYAQDELRLDNWVLTMGGRYDWADAHTDTYTVSTRRSTVVKQDDGEFTGRIGLVYRFDNGLAPYASYSTSFQPTSGTNRLGTPFEPTTGAQIEAGIRYQPPGLNSFVAFSGYRLTQKNVTTPDPTDTRYNTQTGEARVRGLELEGKASLAEGLNVSVSYAYTESEVTRANRAAGASIRGKQLPFVPNHQASAWLDYTFRDSALAGLGLAGGARYIGASYGEVNNVYRSDSVTLFDAALRYDVGRIAPSLQGAQLAVNALNVFDKEYVSTCIAAAGCFWGNRRTVLASLRYRW
jgi:iron complex outermembrane receptor protein